MVTVAVLADPPRPGLVLPRVVDGTVLSATEAADLYGAALRDTVRAVARSGADLLVNYRPEASLPAADRETENEGGNGDPEGEDPAERAVGAAVREALDGIGDDPHVEEPRFEPQVGSSRAARIGNTVTHLLESEGVDGAAVLRPTAPLAGRTELDGAAMKLRRSAVVLGPTAGGRVYYAGFSDPVDFAGADAVPELETLTNRALAADLEVDFVETVPGVATPGGLVSTTALVRARRAAGRPVPEFTARFLADRDLAVGTADGDPAIVRT